MAAVVNARDVLLQATTPRVANVAMASNLVVDQTQVTGLGLVVDGTKMVFLGATTQVFQIAKTGTVSPASTTLTANVRNLVTAPTLSVVSGTINPAPTLVNGSVTIANTAMTTDTATLRLTIVEGGKTYTDDMTLVKVREGIDSLNGFLTNESHTITADYLGNPLSYAGAGGTFKVFQGTNDITALCTFSVVANPSTLTTTIGAATGIYSVTGAYPTATDLTTVTFRATFGTSTIDKVFSIAKAKAATPSKTLQLQASSQVFQIAKNGTITPASISFTSLQNNLAGNPVFTANPAVTITSTSNTATLTYANMGVNDAVTVTVTQDGVQDQVTVVKVREGTDTITAVLSNESHGVAAAFDGSGVNYAGANTTMTIFEGIVDSSNSWSYSTVATNCTVTPTSIAVGATAKNFVVSAMTADIAYVDITATRAGYASVTKRFTVTKNKAGTNGTNGTNGSNGINGVRGSRTYYVALTGATNTFSDTLATTTASESGGPVLNDTVTQYNNGISPGFSQTKFWNGTAWVIVNAVVDGNLLVSGTVGASKISVTSLAAVQANVGNLVFNTDGSIRSFSATNYGTGMGVWMGYDTTTYKFRVGTPGGQGLFWDGTNLTLSGALNAATGTFAGSLSAATGSFAGSLSAATGTFKGGVMGGSYTSYNWPAGAGTGFYLGSEGLLIGNPSVGKYLQVTQDGNIYTPRFSMENGALSMGGGKFTVDAAGNATIDTINIKRRIVLQSGAGDPGINANGDLSYDPMFPGQVFSYDIPQLFVTDIYDTESLNGTFNQPFHVACWPQDGALRGYSGGACTVSFQFTARVAPNRVYSNTGSFANDGRIGFQVRCVMKIESGSPRFFQLPPFNWVLYRL